MKLITLLLCLQVLVVYAELSIVAIDDNGDTLQPKDSIYHITVETDFDGSFHWFLFAEFENKDTGGVYQWLVDDSIYYENSHKAYFNSGRPLGWRYKCSDTAVHTVKLRFTDNSSTPSTDSAEFKIKFSFAEAFPNTNFEGWHLTSQGDSVYLKFAINETSQDFLTITVVDTIDNILIEVEDTGIRENGDWNEYFCRISVDSVGSSTLNCDFVYDDYHPLGNYVCSDQDSSHTGTIVQLSSWVGLLLSRSRDDVAKQTFAIELEITPKDGEQYRETIFVQEVQYISPIIEVASLKVSSILENTSEVKYYNLKGQILNNSQIQNLPKGLIIKQSLDSKGNILLSRPQRIK